MLKKPIIAALLCVIIVLASTVISVHSRLDARCADVSDEFSVPGGIKDQLSALCTAGSGIIKLAEANGLDTATASGECDELRFELDYNSPSALAWLMRMMNREIDDLRMSLRQMQLSENDAKLFSEYETAYLAAQTAISEDTYNQSVNSFLRSELGSFSSFFARLCGVQLPEQFE